MDEQTQSAEQNTTSNEFRIEEYKRLSKEITDRLTSLQPNERYFLIATGAIYVWLFEKKIPISPVWWAPTAIWEFAAWRMITSYYRVEELASYIRLIEN